MNAGLEQQEPHQRAAQQIGQQGHPAQPAVHRHQQQPDRQCCGQVGKRQSAAVKNGNDDDGAQVVDDGKSHNKHLERGWHARAQQGQRTQGKGDVGGHRNADTGLARCAGVERVVNQRRRDDATERCHQRQQGVLQRRQLTAVEFALEFQANQQEKDRHQRIVDPVHQTQARHMDLPQGQVIGSVRAVRQQQRKRRTGDQNQTAGLL